MQRMELPLDEVTISETSAYMVIGSPVFRTGQHRTVLGAMNLRQLSSGEITAIAAKFGGHTRKKDSVSLS